MAKEPEERAAEILAEMDALIRTCEEQLEQSREFYRANGIDPDALAAEVERLPEDRRRELQEALERDMREVEEEVERAKLEASHAPAVTARKKSPRMRPMV